ncbi:MAG: GNAT family N-acetyltransferase, partial [Candidatus Binataceae bacterium]
MSRSGRNGLDREYHQQELTLPDGRRVTLRLMQAADKAAMLSFSRALPPNDLLFLRTDITLSDALDDWIRNLERGATVTVIAEGGGEVVGYASLHHDQTQWTRRVGEIRVLLGPQYRGAGLGRRLAEEVFHIGRARGVKKMAAMLTPDQAGARAAFERLGFQVEALLQSWV